MRNAGALLEPSGPDLFKDNPRWYVTHIYIGPIPFYACAPIPNDFVKPKPCAEIGRGGQGAMGVRLKASGIVIWSHPV
jgi:hypothetical protein